MNEVFGEGNFVGKFIWKNKLGGGNDTSILVTEHEYIMVYAKDNSLLNKFTKANEDNGKYIYEDEYIETRGKFLIEALYRSSISYSESLVYPIECPDGSFIYPNESDKNSNKHIWRWSRQTFDKKKNENRVFFKNTKNGWRVFSKQYFNEDDEGNPRLITIRSIIDFVGTRQGTEMVKNLFNGKKFFDNPKPVSLIKHLIQISTKPGDIVLDFFAGSGTTGHAVMELNYEMLKEYNNQHNATNDSQDSNKKEGENTTPPPPQRKFILVQLPEKINHKKEAYKAGYINIAQITRERLFRAGDKYLGVDTGFKSYTIKKT
jgi:adenine-specific DNA-methyltransferase